MAYVQNVRKRRASRHAIGASFEPFQADLQFKRHCEEQSDEAIQADVERGRPWIASLRSQ
jgi:hypothetical protein